VGELSLAGCTDKATGHKPSVPLQIRSFLDIKVNAEVHLGTRSVLEYLLSLVQKVA